MARNKWICAALPAVMTHLSIGSVYAWSVLSQPIASLLSSSISTVTWAFSIAIFCIGSAAAFLGPWIEKIGPRKALRISALLFGAGMLLSALAMYTQQIALLYLGYGVVGGIGIGIGYIAPVKTLMLWFAQRKGLATGIAVMGFGFASLIAAPVMNWMIDSWDLSTMFTLMAVIYLILIFTASFLLRPYDGQTGNNAPQKKSQTCTASQVELDLKQAMHRKEFYALWIMFFVNILAGISLISNASSMLQEKFTTITPMIAAQIVGGMAVCNGLGRLFWSTLSDYIGRPATYSGMLFLQILLLIGLNYTGQQAIYEILLFVIISCYGAGFSCLPSYLSDLFGTKHVNAIFGAMLTAWAIAGAAGPTMISWIRETTQSYDLMLDIVAILLGIALLFSLIPWRGLRNAKVTH